LKLLLFDVSSRFAFFWSLRGAARSGGQGQPFEAAA